MAPTYRISTRTHPLRIARAPTPATRAKITAAAQATLYHQSAAKDTSICVVYSVDSYLQQLNSQFAGVNAPTDVLSFPADEDDDHLGDIIISAQSAARSAQRAAHGILDEIQMLTVHGTLHLLGHDHSTLEERMRMWHTESAILANLGISISAPKFS